MRIAIFSKRTAEDEYENARLLEEFQLRGCEVDFRNPQNYGLDLSSDTGIIFDGPTDHGLILARTGSGTTAHMTHVMEHYAHIGTPVINSPKSINYAMDKIATMQMAAQHGIPIPRTIVGQTPSEELIDSMIGWPAVVKIPVGSYGDGVYKCTSKVDFKALRGMIRALDKSTTLLVQEFVADRSGSDLRVLIVGGKAVGAMLRQSSDQDFRANISVSGTGSKFPLNDRIVEIAEKICKIQGLEIAGVDLLFNHGDYVLCETNSANGFEGAERYLNINFARMIVDYCLS